MLRPSSSTSSLLAKTSLNPRALIAHWLASTRAASNPGTSRPVARGAAGGSKSGQEPQRFGDTRRAGAADIFLRDDRDGGRCLGEAFMAAKNRHLEVHQFFERKLGQVDVARRVRPAADRSGKKTDAGEQRGVHPTPCVCREKSGERPRFSFPF